MKILIFRIGQLGDTIVALPAIWAIRRQFPNAHLTLLCDRHPGKSYVLGSDLLRDSGLLNQFEAYSVHGPDHGRLSKVLDTAWLLARLRLQRYDALAYLAPSDRPPAQVKRDKLFFRAAGIKNFWGMEGFWPAEALNRSAPLPKVDHEADHLLSRLARSGIATPAVGKGELNLKFSEAEELEVRNWSSGLTPDSRRPWVGFGPGSKMSSKRWPISRFSEVGKELIRKYDVWPVVFGGPEDASVGEALLQDWKRGYNAAGKLSLRAAAFALQQCELYVGNDTGTMHLAAAAGTPCVAIFSARDWPGRWDPYGADHQVLRASIECEGCLLHECVDRKNECLARISAQQVIDACQETLNRSRPSLAKAI